MVSVICRRSINNFCKRKTFEPFDMEPLAQRSEFPGFLNDLLSNDSSKPCSVLADLCSGKSGNVFDHFFVGFFEIVEFESST